MPLEFPENLFRYAMACIARPHTSGRDFLRIRGGSPSSIPCFAGITSHAVEARDLFLFGHTKKNRPIHGPCNEAMGCEARLCIPHWR